MREVWALAGREVRGFLRSPLGYAILAVYALVSGLLLVTLLFLLREQLVRAVPPPGGLPRTAISLQLTVVAPYFYNLATLLFFVVPFITMRAFAEERRARRLELLASYPLRVWQLVLGKYLGACGFTLLLLAVSGAHLLILGLVSSPEAAAVLGAALGLLLLALALVAVGLLVSALVVGQVEAAVLTLGLFLLTAMAGGMVRPGATGVARVLANLSPLYHYQTLAAGLLTPASLLLYAATTLLALALTLRAVDLIRWRG
jgi:ABC-2 type transport system permease protein